MSDKLFVGVGKEKITPVIGTCLYGYVPDHHSESVHDDLYTYAFAFDYADTKALFISITLCGICHALQDELRKEIEAKYGIPYGNIIIAATHTHSGPNICGTTGWGDIDKEYYNGYFLPGFRKAVDDAVNSKQEAVVATAVGNSYVGVNRRELTAENKIDFGQSPWGVHNPKMTLISFKNKNDDIIGNIISYGCHGTSAGRNREITRDWAGIMTDAVETVSGAVTAFFNGPEGDQGPRLSNGRTVGNIKLTEELGAIAAADALRIFNTLGEYKEVSVSCHSDVAKLPLLKRVPLEVAKSKIDGVDGSKLVNIMKQTYEHYVSVVKSYEEGYVEEDFRDINLDIIRIGNVAFVASPYELFMEINLRIDKIVEDLDVIVLSNANGSGGYFPTESELCRGGYEINCFKYQNIQCYTDDADFQLIKETVRILGDLKR